MLLWIFPHLMTAKKLKNDNIYCLKNSTYGFLDYISDTNCKSYIKNC